MEFIDTVYWRRICDLSVYALRKFLEEKKQYAVWTGLQNVSEVIQEQSESGARYVDKIYDKDGGVHLIFEK